MTSLFRSSFSSVFHGVKLSFVFALVLFGLSSGDHLLAQDWAKKMFKIRSHDFGTVAKGSETEFKFEFENLYKEDLVFGSVRSSCGCTIPSMSKKVVKSREKAHVLAIYNTKNFVGNRSATLTVSILKPYRAEVQLMVKGVIRNDVQIQPGKIDFGNIAHGVQAVKIVKVDYRGFNRNWKIKDIKSTFEDVRVSLKQGQRTPYGVSYSLTARLLPSAKEGINRGELIIETNDGATKRIPLVLLANVIPSVQMLPKSIELGKLKPGQKVTKFILVRAAGNCQIKSVVASDPQVKARVPKGKKKLHRIPVVFTAGKQGGAVRANVQLQIDNGSVFSKSVPVNAVIESPARSAKKIDPQPVPGNVSG